MRRSKDLAVVILSSLFALGLVQGQGQPAAPFVVHQLKPNVYWVEGGGGNSGVIVGDKGVIVVDAKTSAAGGKELLDDICLLYTSHPFSDCVARLVHAIVRAAVDGDGSLAPWRFRLSLIHISGISP